MTEMEGYEDYNLMVRVRNKNGFTTERGETVYVLKISHFSTARHTLDICGYQTYPHYMCEAGELQNQMLMYLARHGILTCSPRKTFNGVYTELFAAQEGVTFEESGKPAYLLHSIGNLVGKICNILKSFRFEHHKHTSSPFDIRKALAVEEYTDKYLSGDMREMGQQILQQYKMKIKPNLEKLQQGFIIADINSRNIIVKRLKDRNTSNDYVIAGIIDLGYACKSVYLYEIAVIMADLMSSCFCSLNPLTVGKQLLAGIREYFKMTELELYLLKLCICVRLAQVHLIIEDIIQTRDEHRNIEYFEKCRRSFLKVCIVAA